MTENPSAPADTYEADPILAELAHYHDLIRMSRAKLAADRQLVTESQKAVEEIKKRLAYKAQKL